MRLAQIGADPPITLSWLCWAMGIQALGAQEAPHWQPVHEYSEELARRFCELAPDWELRHSLLELGLWLLTKSKARKAVRGPPPPCCDARN